MLAKLLSIATIVSFVVADQCSTTSPKTGNFFDLSPLIAGVDRPDWQVPGLDYGYNFTLNFCAPLAHNDGPFEDAVPLAVSASYTDDHGVKYSLGRSDTHPFFRGRELVLEYHGGSFCLDPLGQNSGIRKSALVSFKCDHQMSHEASATLVGHLSECAYFFEVKTPHACAVMNEEQTMAPVGVFLLIVVVAAIVVVVSNSRGSFIHLTTRHRHLNEAKKVFLMVWNLLVRIATTPFRVVKSRRLPL